jgi:hypothetical protein
LAPPDGDNLCPSNADEPDGPGDSLIDMTWRTVSGATFYIVQICNNSSFHGPTLRSVKRPATGGSTQTFVPEADVDIRLSETVHWRVMAYNTTGGVSQKSDAWSYTYDCDDDPGSGGNKGKTSKPSPPSGSGPGGVGGHNKPKCEKFNIKVNIDGPAQTMCSDAVMYHLQAAYACKDADGADLIGIFAVIWEVFPAPDSGPPFFFPCVSIRAQNKNLCVLDITKCKSSQTFLLRCNVIFENKIDATKLNCVAEKRIFVDCETGKNEYKPWLLNNYINDPVGYYPNSIIYTHPDYHDDTIAEIPNETLPLGKTKVVTPLGSTEGQGLSEKKKGIGVGPVIRFAIEDLGKADSGTTFEGKPGVPFPGRMAGEKKEARIHIPLGCGLSIDTTVPAGEKKIGIDLEELIGESGSRVGLEPNVDNEANETCLIEVAVGCGTAIYNEAVVVDEVDLAGRGLESASSNTAAECALDVKLGECLEFDANDAIAFDKNCLVYATSYINYGCGLKLESGKLVVNPVDLAGPGLEIYGDCGLKIDQGCGLIITGGTTLEVNNIDLVEGPGLSVYGDDCGIQVDIGCGLEFTAGQVAVDTATLAGPGIDDYVGCGFQVDPGCGLKLSDNTKAASLQVDNTELVGPGLLPYGDCGLEISTGCGLEIGLLNTLQVANDELAGKGLSAYGTCELEADLAACGGLDFTVSDEIEVDHVKTHDYTFHTIKDDNSAIALTLSGCELKLTLTLVEQRIGSNCGGVHFGNIPTGAEKMISGTIILPTSEIEVLTGISGLNCYCTPITETIKHINC